LRKTKLSSSGAKYGYRFDRTITAFGDFAEAAKDYPYIKMAWSESLGTPGSNDRTEREENTPNPNGTKPMLRQAPK
jgi:hypothetical protein